jgi:hypothetical protein
LTSQNPNSADSSSAVVIGRWGDDAALLRTEDGRTLEASVPVPLRATIDVGATVDVVEGDVVDWRRGT